MEWMIKWGVFDQNHKDEIRKIGAKVTTMVTTIESVNMSWIRTSTVTTTSTGIITLFLIKIRAFLQEKDEILWRDLKIYYRS